MAKFESKYAIGDKVAYNRFFPQTDTKPKITDYGIVASILFTKAKVFYNILNDYDASVDHKIDSICVIKKTK